MKTKLIFAGAAAVLLSVSPVLAHEGMDHSEGAQHKGSMMEEKGSMTGGTEQMGVALPNAGNKICPISGEKVGEMGEVVQVEHEGVTYNLCCKMCAKDFKKDPQKFIQKINRELESSGDAAHEHDH